MIFEQWKWYVCNTWHPFIDHCGLNKNSIAENIGHLKRNKLLPSISENTEISDVIDKKLSSFKFMLKKKKRYRRLISRKIYRIVRILRFIRKKNKKISKVPYHSGKNIAVRVDVTT